MSKQAINLAIVVSQFNDMITGKLLDNALQCLEKNGIAEKEVYVAKVPGAVEIPLIAKLLAKTKKYDAIICLGAVIRGETNHYDYVCQQVSNGCQQVMLEHELPVIFGILTTENEFQAETRINKGGECVEAALTMVDLAKRIAAKTSIKQA